MNMENKFDRLMETKTAIKGAIENKGVTVDETTTFRQYAEKIAEINTATDLEPEEPTIEDWEPHPDWWDIKAIVNTGAIPWLINTTLNNVLYAYIITSDNTTIDLPAGNIYYLSDGSNYDGSEAVTHTFDWTSGLDCAKGYKTHCVVVCGDRKAGTSITTKKAKYLYIGECYITYFLIGASSQNGANLAIECVESNGLETYYPGNYVEPYIDEYGYEAGGYWENISLDSYTFGNCVLLEKVDLSFNGLEVFPGRLFYNNYSLRFFKQIPTNVKSTSFGMFGGCRSLTKVELHENIEVMEAQTFYQCYSLPKIAIPANVNDLRGDSIFYYTNWEEIPNLENTQITNLANAFFTTMQSLKTLKFPPTLIDLGSATANTMYALRSLSLPGENITGSLTINQCYSLTTIEVGDNFKASLKVSDSYCLSHESLANLVDNYADLTGEEMAYLTIGAHNVAKLTADQKATLAAKNIKLA